MSRPGAPRTLMLQGTGSHVGKTVLTAGLCRIFRDAGFSVAPFKAQNMALNAYVTQDGGEIGWAQAMQAEAAGVEPTVDMNPILLKPQTGGSQVIVHGRVRGTLSARDYYARRAELWEAVTAAYRRLADTYEVIVIEGAGSPAEPNLMAADITNMVVARLARAPVVLVGDIDRGGVFASLLGSLALLSRVDRRRVRGFLINRFRGDAELLTPALEFLTARSRRPVLGVVPYLADLHLPEEDSVALDYQAAAEWLGAPGAGAGRETPKWGGQGGEWLGTRRAGTGPLLKIAVVRLPHIANFTDFAPLAADPTVRLHYVRSPDELRGAALAIIPGSKDTLADLRWLHATGFAETLRAHVALGGRLGGVCGGFQMLGRSVEDPEGVEGGGRAEGLGCLPVTTLFESGKVTRRVRARLSRHSEPFEAYEIHLGRTQAGDGVAPFAFIKDGDGSRPDGAASPDGRVWGTYLHGLFDTPHVRAALLAGLAGSAADGTRPEGYGALRERGYARLAEVIAEQVDLGALRELMGVS